MKIKQLTQSRLFYPKTMPFFDFGKTAGELVLVFEVPDLDLKYLFPESYLEMSAAQLSEHHSKKLVQYWNV